jgi:hypothetical protein
MSHLGDWGTTRGGGIESKQVRLVVVLDDDGMARAGLRGKFALLKTQSFQEAQPCPNRKRR